MREELLKGLTEEQKKKVAGCNSAEEVLALAKEEGITLTDEQLEAVSGGCGGGGSKPKCPECGSKDVDEIRYEHGTPGTPDYRGYEDRYQCNKCGYRWYDRHRINPNNAE